MSRTASASPPGLAQLPVSSEYALRAMVCLAHAQGDVWTPRERLVRRAHLPGAYASKVLRKLVVAGLVDAQRGWNGGFRLARPAAQITLLDVLRAVDGPLALEHCAFGYPRCDASRPCPLHHLRVELQRTMLGWAASSSLASLPPCPPEEDEAQAHAHG